MYSRNVVAFVLAFFLVLSMFATVFPVNADKIPVKAYVSAQPSTIGLGQIVVLNGWTVPPPPPDLGTLGSHGATTGSRRPYYVNITRPDGTIDSSGPHDSFGEGSFWTTYTPNAIGTYSVVLIFKGDANYSATVSPPFTFTVQSEPKYSYLPDTQLPDYYWQRPINGENRLWYAISGDWRQTTNQINGQNYQPYSVGPKSPHILWTIADMVQGGLIGGVGQGQAYECASEITQLSTMVMAGKIYINHYGTYYCFDADTGTKLWSMTPPSGSLYYVAMPEHDYYVKPPDYARQSEDPYDRPYIYAAGNGYVTVYDATSLTLFKNITGPGAGIRSTYQGFFYAYSNGRLLKWDPNFQSGMLVTTFGTNFTNLIIWNVSAPGAPQRFWNDIGLNYQGGPSMGSTSTVGTISLGDQPYMLTAINITNGQILWQKNVTEPNMCSFIVSDNGYIFSGGESRDNFDCWDIRTGNKVWTSDDASYPWGNFWSYGGFASAYNQFYANGYSGVYAFDEATGKLNWRFYEDSGLETPYGDWCFWSTPIVADGAIYVGTGDHTPQSPRPRGYGLYSIDTITGNLNWKLLNFEP